MKKTLILTVVFVAVAVSIFSQIPTPTPIEKDDEVVVISTNLIQIDVTVTDKDGKIVTDLKPEDFEIFENGKTQKISNFSYINTTSNKSDVTKTTKEGVLLPAKQIKTEQAKRKIALVVDDLTLSFQSTAYVIKALRKFVDEQMQEGDLVAIVRTGAGIGALQQFTNDKRLLHAAIDKVKWNPLGIGRIGAFDAIGTSFNDLTERAEKILEEGRGGSSNNNTTRNSSSSEDVKRLDDRRKNIQTQINEFEQNVFGAGTLGALNYIIRGMKDVSGRKSVIFFSDGLNLFFRNEGGVLEPSVILESLRRLTDLANRSSVVVFSIDSRGLQTFGLNAQDYTNELTPQKIEDRLTERRTEFFDTQEGLYYLSKETGGFSVFNSNDLSLGVDRILENQKGYYLIGYEPDDQTFDPVKSRYNKLTIKVKREGLKVQYRSGFFGITNDKVLPKTSDLYDKTLNALASPFVINDIPLQLNVVFGNDSKGSFIRTFLHISAKDLKFIKQTDGSETATFSIIAVNFGENGIAFDEISKTYKLNLRGESLENVMKNGFIYDFLFPVKKQGAYQMRIGLIDNNTEKTGSASQFIEVPNLKKNHLAISDLVLENFSNSQWKKVIENSDTNILPTNPLADTTIRKFKKNTVLRYGFEIYNAKKSSDKFDLVTQVRLYRDQSLVFEGKQNPYDANGQTDLNRLKATGFLNLGDQLKSGDYILQLIVSDNFEKENYKTVMKFVRFEIE